MKDLCCISHLGSLAQARWKSSFANKLVTIIASTTQFIWFGTPQQLHKLDFALLSEKFPLFSFSSSVRDLGVTLDSSLTFTEHISNLTRSSYFHLRRLRVIRRSVSSSIFTTLVHAFVFSLIDYTAIPFLLVFLRFVSLLFSLSSTQLLD